MLKVEFHIILWAILNGPFQKIYTSKLYWVQLSPWPMLFDFWAHKKFTAWSSQIVKWHSQDIFIIMCKRISSCPFKQTLLTGHSIFHSVSEILIFWNSEWIYYQYHLCLSWNYNRIKNISKETTAGKKRFNNDQLWFKESERILYPGQFFIHFLWYLIELGIHRSEPVSPRTVLSGPVD